jgi:hypothetical protein
VALARTDLLQAISGTSGNFGTGNYTTGSFTPPSSSLLVVAEVYVENSGTTTDPASSLTISGGGWTYSAGPSITAAPTAFPTTVKIWTAAVSTGASMTLTLGAGGRSAGMYAVSVVAYTGYDTGTPTGATATGQQNGGFAGPPTPAAITLSGTPATSSECFAAVGMDKSLIGTTPGSSPTTWTEVHDSMHSTDWGGLETEVRSGVASTSVSWDDLRSGGGALFNMAAAAIEIRAASASVAFPPSQQVRRRLSVAPRLPRGSARIAAPVRAQVNPPFPFTGIKQPRRLRGLLARRGEMFTPVPSQVVVAAPVFPPRPVRARLKALRLYRGEMFAPPSDQLSNARQPQRPRLRLPRIFRGRTAAPVPAQVVVVPPAYPPQSVRTRLRGLRIFRGRAAAAVPAQIVVTPPSFTPLAVRTRLRFVRLFRGRAAAPAPDQLVAPPAPHLRPRGMAPRRGHAAMPVPPQIVAAPPAYPVRPVRPRLKGLRGVRGRQAAMPVPPQVVIVPPKMVPLFTRLKQHAARIFRGESRAVLPPACDCTTHRPNLGTTTRPSSGITARPDSGTTSRPCSCND